MASKRRVRRDRAHPPPTEVSPVSDQPVPSGTHDALRRDRAKTVARLVVEKGMAVNSIASELLPTEYGNKKTRSRALMRIKRSLHLAIDLGIIRLNPPPCEELQAALSKEFNGITFEVLDDAADTASLRPENPVCLAAARRIASEIDALLQRKTGEVVIANTSGWTVNTAVRYLQAERNAPPEDQARRLNFISLNAAGIAQEYQVSANFLAVRMAEIYRGRHITVLDVWPPDVEQQYEAAVRDIDLLVCGAGTMNGFFFRWYQQVRQQGLVYPPEVVGDIALLPIDRDGARIRFSDDVSQFITSKLKPRPSYEDFQSLAHQGKVLLILAQTAEESKVDVALAIFKRRLASRCVLGSSLASSILARAGASVPA